MTRTLFASVGLALARLLAPAAAVGQPEANIDTRPRPVEPGARDVRVAEEAQRSVDAFRTWADRINTATGERVNFNSPYDLSGLKKRGVGNANLDVAGVLQAALNLLEAFEFIDPREKFLQPDYAPRGMPPLPSRGVNDATLSAADYGEFLRLQANIDKAKRHLEGNYVVLKQTELKTKRLEQLAGSAANMSGIAGLYWATIQGDPTDPLNVSKARFYATYDSGQENGLEFLNDALKEMSEFEKRVYGDGNWYLYFGLPYYNYMQTRYTRAGG